MSLGELSAFITAHGPWAGLAALLIMALGFVVRQNAKLHERIDGLQEKRVTEARETVATIAGFRTTLEANNRILERLIDNRVKD